MGWASLAVGACSRAVGADDDEPSGSGGNGGNGAATAGGSAGGGAAGTGGAIAQGASGGAAGVGSGGVARGGTTSGASGSGALGGSSGGGGSSAGSGGVSGGGTSGGGGVAVGGEGGAGAGSSGTPSVAGSAGAGASGASQGGGAGTGSGLGGGGSGNDGLLVPSQGALLGAFVGTGTWMSFEALLGRSLPIVHDFFGFYDDWVPRARTVLQSGKTPLITWEPWTNGSTGIPLDEIIGGTHDTIIRARGTAARDLGGKMFLRWGHEMNGNWYPWAGFNNGANAAATQKYIAAYRRIHDLFEAAGATNVLWVFCPNVDSVPGDAWNAWANYYPGDDYVDWMGFDGYNWGTVQSGSTWRSFSAIAGAIYPSLAGKNKPIMIAETASAEQGGDKAAWIAGILPALQTSYPAIKAFVWFEVNKETDWRVESTPGARDSFVSFANAPYMNP